MEWPESRLEREMREAAAAMKPYAWYNIDDLSPAAVEELGIDGAIKEYRRISSHVNSSGQSPKMSRKVRKEHYSRKIAKYKKHEDDRRARWERRHPGAPESNWERREEKHRANRQARRNTRRKRSTSKRS